MGTTVNRARFAALAMVSKPAITKAVREGRLLLTEGGRIDIEDSRSIEYLSKHVGREDSASIRESAPSIQARGKSAKKKLAKKKLAKKKLAKKKPAKKTTTAKENAAAIKKLTEEERVRQSIEMKKLEGQALAIKLKNDETVGKIIPRDLVRRAILEPLETEQVRLLSDGSSSIVALLFPAIRGNCTPEEAEKIVRDQLSTFIKARKRTIIRMLKNTPYEGSPSSGADARGSGVQDG